MSIRRLAILVTAAAAVLAAAATPAAAAKSYRAERFHSRVVVEPGGSIVVTETIRFAFGPDQFTYVYRELPSRRTDGLTIIEASMDGVPMERGKGAGQFELKRDDNKRRIVWHFPATSNASRTFTVTYRAAGVVWQDTESDVLAWTLLPTRREYAIDCASGEVAYPADAALVAEAVLDPSSPDVRHEGRTVRFERCPFEGDASWVVSLRFAPRSVAPIAPGWQQRSIRSRENTPLFLGLGGLLLLAGLGGLVMFALNHRHARAETSGAVSSPPDDLRPALAGTLISTGASAGWGPVLGAVMELARRGTLIVESVEKAGLFKSQEVRITRGPAVADAAPHERVLLELLFNDKNGPRTSVTFSELATTFASSRRWTRLKEAIASDLRTERLLDADRERTRGRVMLIGLVMMLLSVAGFIASVALFDRVGEPVLSLPIALLIVGVAGMITGASWSPLSEEGYRRAGRWRAFKRTLGDAPEASAGGAPGAQHLERWLPYAVAFGTALAWTKRLQKQGVTIGPSWLAAVSRDGARGPAGIGATVAILSAGSSAGAHAGGHPGGVSGAAGGGASGAG
ncbi:MAG: DUF2207 domain-containing protein [Vicinamibacterales bacterium]|jgi:hypothetical protein|nr:DUF2207 domain-containing protein [Vicinamibacterales bacterium]